MTLDLQRLRAMMANVAAKPYSLHAHNAFLDALDRAAPALLRAAERAERMDALMADLRLSFEVIAEEDHHEMCDRDPNSIMHCGGCLAAEMVKKIDAALADTTTEHTHTPAQAEKDRA